MKPREWWAGLAVLLWFAFRERPGGSADVSLRVNDPALPEITGQSIPSWPPEF